MRPLVRLGSVITLLALVGTVGACTKRPMTV